MKIKIYVKTSEMRDIYPNNVWLQLKTNIVLTVHFDKYHLMCLCNCINTYMDVCYNESITILYFNNTMFFRIYFTHKSYCVDEKHNNHLNRLQLLCECYVLYFGICINKSNNVCTNSLIHILTTDITFCMYTAF